MDRNFVKFIKGLREMGFIEDYRVSDDGWVKIVFHAPRFRLSACKALFASLGMKVVDVEAELKEGENITLWLEEVQRHEGPHCSRNR